MYCFGVSNHSPDQALHFLVKRKVVEDESGVAIVPSGTLLSKEKKPSRPILFILSISDFYRNLSVLNSSLYRNVQLFVFASTLRVTELSHSVWLDFEPNPANKGLSFSLQKELNFLAYKAHIKTDGAAKVERLKTKYLTLLTDNVKHGSLLNPLMTFLYTLPSSTHQTPVKEAVVDYLYKGTKFVDLEETLDSVKGVIISKRIRDRLKDILQTDAGNNIRAAFKAYRAAVKAEKVIPWPSLAKQHTVSEYELKYLKSVYDSKVASRDLRGKQLSTTTKKAA